MLCLRVSIRIVIVYIMDIIRRWLVDNVLAMDGGAGAGAEQQARCRCLTRRGAK
jgi:hypothetical protein